MIIKISKRTKRRNLYSRVVAFSPQEVVPWGVSCWTDTGDDAAGRRGPHPAPHRTHHTPVQGVSRCLRSSLHSRARSSHLRVQRGAQAEARCQKKQHGIIAYTYGRTERRGRVLCNPAEKIKSMDTKRRGLIASVSTGRQQSALSCDISTWHNHAFLKHFPCTHTAIWYTGNTGTQTQDPHRLWLSPLTISWDPTATSKSRVLGRMKKGG